MTTLAGPIQHLSNETLLEIFGVIADPLPPYRPASVKPDYAAFPLSQVSRRWRTLAHRYQRFWRKIIVDLPGIDGGASRRQRQRRPRYSLRLLRLALRNCTMNVELEITTRMGSAETAMQHLLGTWFLQHPAGVASLQIQGDGTVNTLTALSDALDGRRLSSLEVLTLEIDTHSFRPTASNAIVRCVAGLLVSPSRVRNLKLCLNESYANCGELTESPSKRKMSIFTATHDASSSMLSNLTTMTLVNSPALLSFARAASLTTLSLTCSTSFLKGDLVHHLSDVITSSGSSLRSLDLQGWLTWGDDKLLESIRTLKGLTIFTLHFYITFAIITERSETHNTSYVDGIVACWGAVCELQTLTSMLGKCKPCVEEGESSELDVNYIFDRMDKVWCRSDSPSTAAYTMT